MFNIEFTLEELEEMERNDKLIDKKNVVTHSDSGRRY